MPRAGKDGKTAAASGKARRVGFGRYKVALPSHPFLRIGLGLLLIAGGFLWFLPVLGLWMLPLGIVVLSVDFHPVRRFRRRAEVWWGRSPRVAKSKHRLKAAIRRRR